MTFPTGFPKSCPENYNPSADKAMKEIPEWDSVLSAICRSQSVIGDGVHVAASLGAHPDRDLIMSKFDAIIGCKPSLFISPMRNVVNFRNIETCIKELKRTVPLETVAVEQDGRQVFVPTNREILIIKSSLILLRNATMDYVDLAIFSSRIGALKSAEALKDLDKIYPLSNEMSVLQQMLKQIGSPFPYDFADITLGSCESLAPKWCIWDRTVAVLQRLAAYMFDAACQGFTPRPYEP
jgi:hypothetical protein